MVEFCNNCQSPPEAVLADYAHSIRYPGGTGSCAEGYLSTSNAGGFFPYPDDAGKQDI